jgi:DNA-binding transcriptional LysR family regulator
MSPVKGSAQNGCARSGGLAPLHDLYVFSVVARLGSVTQAAAELSLSQSAVSQTLRRVEIGLGQRLFSRTATGLVPTLVGAEMQTALAPRFERIAQATEAIGSE